MVFRLTGKTGALFPLIKRPLTELMAVVSNEQHFHSMESLHDCQLTQNMSA